MYVSVLYVKVKFLLGPASLQMCICNKNTKKGNKNTWKGVLEKKLEDYIRMLTVLVIPPQIDIYIILNDLI